MNGVLDKISGDKVDISKFKRVGKEFIPLIRPDEMEGRTIVGTVTGIVSSAKFDQEILQMHHNGVDFQFPVTAAIESRLKEYTGKKKVDIKSVKGLTLLIRGLGQRKIQSGRYAGKMANSFEVFVKNGR